jgi:CO/xanthine dehydrogenase Mo-binding subunit
MKPSGIACSRREFLQGTGALVLMFSIASPLTRAAERASRDATGRPPLTPDQLDSWIAVRRDGGVTIFVGKIDCGQGTDVAIAQIAAEELDVAVGRVSVIMGDTFQTCNQGGASASSGVRLAGAALRMAAVEARRILLARASARLGIPVERLVVHDGVISVPRSARRIEYASLLEDGLFREPIGWNERLGNELQLSARAQPKRPKQYRIVGKSVPRSDVAGKVIGAIPYVTDIRVAGMLHGRIIRPPIAGSIPLDVDAKSITAIAGAQLVRRGDFIGVVAEKEWNAVKAARELKVTWSQPADAFPAQDALYDWIRSAPVEKREVLTDSGTIDEAMADAAQVLEAWYEWPFQSHASLGPGCAVADVRSNGATIWTGTQKPHFAAQGIAAITGLKPETVRVIWTVGPGSYGRNDAGDAAFDAAVLSQLLGRPVRVQYTREQGTAWDPKAPASVHRLRAALDRERHVVAWDVLAKGFSRTEINPAEARPGDTLAGQLLGFGHAPRWAFAGPEQNYQFSGKRVAWEVIAPLLARASPLRTTHMRDPCGPQNHFASESFIDEIAAAVGADPIQFPLSHLTDPRDRAVLQAVAERAGWRGGPSGARGRRNGDWAFGRGVAYSAAGRAGTVVAMIADAEVNLQTGELRVPRVVVAHDCGLIVNPKTLKAVIEGNVVQGLSRAIYEEVRFSSRAVTSVDWISYPILDIGAAPETIDVVLIDRPDLPSGGAGEPTTRLVAPAVNNAIFEAIGRRVRRAPLGAAVRSLVTDL